MPNIQKKKKNYQQLTLSQKIEVEKQVKKQLKIEEKLLEKKIEAKLHKKVLSATKKHARKKTKYLHEQFKNHASTAIIAAFGFLIALVWRDLIVKLTKDSIKIETLEKFPFLAELYTALVVTIIAILGIALISKWAKKEEKQT